MSARSLLCLAPVALALLLPGAAAAQVPGLHVEPYAFRLADGTELAAERGTFSVPEDRNNPRSRRIVIGFVRFRSTNPHPGTPIVYLAGGPGGSGVATAQGPRQPIFLALRQVADVIAFDQRGTGLSNHIPPCRAEHRLDPALTFSEATLAAYYRETLDLCVVAWRRAGVAVNGYTTEQSAADIEELRQLLRVPRVNLWAISYGTQLGMATMRRFPRSVGRAVFASADGTGQRVKLPAHLDRVYARIDGVVPGDFVALMRRVHARFDAEPQSFTMNTPQGALTIRADSFPLRMMAGILPKNPDGIGQFAGAYRALDAGQRDALAPLVYNYFYREPLTMTGMAELMTIASGISDRRLALVRRQVPASLTATAINFPMPDLRRAVPGLELGDRYRREVRSNIPVLLFSGDLDVRTPLEEQAEATAGLSNRHQIIVRNGGHDLFEAHPEIPGLMIAFFSGRPVTVRELSLPAPATGR